MAVLERFDEPDPGPDLFEHAPCGYAVLDASGLVLDANIELLRLLGRARGDVVGHRTLPSLVSAGGRSYFESHIFPRLQRRGEVHEVALELVREDDARVPILLNANVVGADVDGPRYRAVLFEVRDRRRYEADLLEAVRATEEARRAAAELAEQLQQTLIPPSPPQIEGLEVAASYRPAGDGSEVGGDFYDVFQVAAQEWMLVIGDVMGKGVAAAAVTAFVRHTVRDLAMQVTDPAELLAAMDRALAEHPTERFSTLVVARLTREDGDWTIRGSAGGHPLPLLRRADGTVTSLGRPGSLVGLLSHPTFHSFQHRLGSDLLLLYTDGVVEGRHDGEQYGDARLAQVIASSPADPALLTEAIVDSVLAFQSGDAADDIAVVALRCVEPAPRGRAADRRPDRSAG